MHIPGYHSQYERAMVSSVNYRCLIGLAVLAAIGCGGSQYDADVSGQVTLDGEPIGPGVVTFAPEGGTSNPAIGAIDEDGNYLLLTKHERGLNAGTYKVAVQVYEPEEPVPEGQRSTQTPEPLVPKKYLRTETSGITQDVAKGSQTIDLALTSS